MTATLANISDGSDICIINPVRCATSLLKSLVLVMFEIRSSRSTIRTIKLICSKLNPGANRQLVSCIGLKLPTPVTCALLRCIPGCLPLFNHPPSSLTRAGFIWNVRDSRHVTGIKPNAFRKSQCIDQHSKDSCGNKSKG